MAKKDCTTGGIVVPKSVRTWTDLQVNNHFELYTHAPDVEAVEDMLQMDQPRNVLEIGAGLGRGSMWLERRFGWKKTNFWLADGEGRQRPEVRGLNDKEAPDAFYNSFIGARTFMEANGVEGERIKFVDMVRASRKDEIARLRKSGVKFDLAYSFRAVGFHWPTWEALNMFHEFIKPNARVVLDMRGSVLGSKADRAKGRLPKNQRFCQANVEWVRKDGRYWIEQWRECPAPDSGLGNWVTADHCRAYMVLRRK